MHINTDNIVFEKIWDDGDLTNNWASGFYEINIIAYNSYLKINGFNVYMTDKLTKELSKLISKYLQNNEQVIFENNFSASNEVQMMIEIKPTDFHGYVIIALKVEKIDNNGNRNIGELCVETELGLLENFGKNILNLISSGVGYKVYLNKEIE